MKKFTVFMAAALCVVGLTACGSKNDISAYQQAKLDSAEKLAVETIIPTLNKFADGGMEQVEAEYGIIPWDELTMDDIELVCSGALKIDVDGYGFYNARSSFMTAAESLGAIKKDANGIVLNGEVKSYVDGTQIVVSVPVKCEKGEATAEIIISNDMDKKLESASLNENYTMGQKMSKAGLNTLMGMGTVFSVLILISLLISVFGVIPKIQKNAADKKAAKAAAKTPAEAGIDNAVNQIIANETAEEDDTELVAVIAAAIAAFEGSGSTDGYVVRSIRRRR